MATKNFVDYETIIDADWANDVDFLVYDIFDTPATAAEACSAIGLGVEDSPTFTGLTLSGLTASKLVVTDANKALASSSLSESDLTGLSSKSGMQWLAFAITGETETVTSGTSKFVVRLPACTLWDVRASLKTPSSSGNPAIDINDDTVSVFATTLTIDSSEKTSVTAATAYSFTGAAASVAIADDSEITIDVDTAGTNAVGLKVYLLVTWTTAPS